MTTSSAAERQVDRLVAELHQTRLRVWSIVISFFGDAVTPRGGVLWLGAFRPIATRLGIEAGTLGAALSRLVADGWLEREKRGRHSLYRLAGERRADFEEATRRVYCGLSDGAAPDEASWDGAWSIVVLRDDARPPPGFVQIDQRTWVRPEGHGRSESTPCSAITFRAHGGDARAVRALAYDAWELGPVAAHYQRFMTRFSPLRTELEAGAPLDPISAISARTLLIHAFRKVVLRDPELPDALRPADWSGHTARREARTLYRVLLEASEAWLDAPDRTPEGPLPPPNPAFYRRFGGLK